ncbi:MAG: phosphotransferase [Chloroflexi bacterium AL-W]|nr:phosphotransferase [Chloroflexi bacterium AL-N1]NOK71666.1 phosphotransferase [Chloroflexi bacterium AL-N10]NOK79007.1 phosphotransferase [Chloroflexi bacterium AL-N5]NOK86441.1 phosphotransferase [Chloroflexi bacterium AL-W]NOK93407.1 phosphotransferase [Chloroflexi bacterium AL-N15]
MSIELLASYKQVIERHCADVVIDDVHLMESGQNNIVLIVHDAFVFRFARYMTSIDTLRKEVEILRYIQPFLTTAIPQPGFVHLDDSNIGESFVGYPFIAGKPLGRADFDTIDMPDVLDTLAHQLAVFLYELHSVSINAGPLAGFPIRGTMDQWRQMYQKVQNQLFVYMRPDAREHVQWHFAQFLEQNQLLPFIPVLRHGDFGLGNILYDSTTYRVTGVVDFGSAGLGDPATDLAGVLAGCGKSFLQQVLHYYPEARAMLGRIHFYCGTFALQEALFGLENDDQAAFTDGMADYI